MDIEHNMRIDLDIRQLFVLQFFRKLFPELFPQNVSTGLVTLNIYRGCIDFLENAIFSQNKNTEINEDFIKFNVKGQFCPKHLLRNG